jgi:hypothetical protein
MVSINATVISSVANARDRMLGGTMGCSRLIVLRHFTALQRFFLVPGFYG